MARKPRIPRRIMNKLQNLTIDYRSLLALSFVDRINMAKSDTGQQILSTLTPEQLENLFPNYYKKQLRGSISGAASGGIPFDGQYPAKNWRLDPTQTEQRQQGERQRVSGPTATPIPKESPELKKSWQKRLEEAEQNNQIPSGKGLESWSGAPVAQHRVKSITEGPYGKLIENEAKRLGIDPNVAKAIAHIESGGKHDVTTGSYSGLFQTKGGSSLAPEEHIRDALKKMKTMGENFEKNMGRPPTPSEMYLMHQQGIAGGPAHIRASTTNQEAWKTIRQYYKSDSMAKQAIWGNVPSDFKKMFGNVENISSSQFAAMWASKLQGIPYEQALEQAKKTGIIGQYGPPKEEARKELEDATKAQQQPNQTGKVFPQRSGSVGQPDQQEQAQPQQIPGAVPPLPEGLNKIIADYIASLPKDRQEQAARNIKSNIERNPNFVAEINKQAEEEQSQKQRTTATPYQPNENFGKVNTAPDIKSLKELNLEEKFPQGQQRFFRDSGGTKGLNPKLIEVLKEASKDLPPGYHVRMFSGVDARTTGTKNHPGGIAVDLKIVDSKGKPLSDRGFGEGHKLYEQLAQSMKIRGQTMFPGTDYIWGGAWRAAGGDRMHYQIVDPDQLVRGASTSSGQYSFEKGVSPNLWAGQGAVKSFMSPEELQRYRQSILEQIQKEKEEMKAKKVTSPVVEKTPSAPIEEPSQPIPIQQRGITSFAGATVVPEQRNQTGSAAPIPPRGVTPLQTPPRPEQSIPQPEPVPNGPGNLGPLGIISPGSIQDETPPVAGEYGGGTLKTPANDPNVILDKKGKFAGYVNADQEIFQKDSITGEVKVVPKRINPDELIDKTREQREDQQIKYAQQINEENSNPRQIQGEQPIERQQSNPNLTDMYNYTARVDQRESPSHDRAMKNAVSFGNPIQHFGYKSTTTNIT